MGERPRWVRILLITGGSLMEEMIFIFPPQFVHFDTSTPNTRARSFAGELFLREVFSSEVFVRLILSVEIDGRAV